MRLLEVCIVSENGSATRNYPTIDDALGDLGRYPGPVSVEAVVIDGHTVYQNAIEFAWEGRVVVGMTSRSTPLHTLHPERSSIPHAPTDG